MRRARPLPPLSAFLLLISSGSVLCADKYADEVRPILERLKKIDGRAPVSIMTCKVDPKHPHLQKWLKEGLSIEVHTYDHPCPCLQKGDFQAAKATYTRCVDLMADIPGNRPVPSACPAATRGTRPAPGSGPRSSTA